MKEGRNDYRKEGRGQEGRKEGRKGRTMQPSKAGRTEGRIMNERRKEWL
jgi:hypothetical protein